MEMCVNKIEQFVLVSLAWTINSSWSTGIYEVCKVLASQKNSCSVLQDDSPVIGSSVTLEPRESWSPLARSLQVNLHNCTSFSFLQEE